jgi:hypothetical protein
MPGFLSRMFRKKQHADNKSKIQNGVDTSNGPVIQMDPWEKTSLRREDVVELLKAVCDELKSRGTLPVPRPCPSRESGRGFVIETHVRFGYSVISVTVPSVF